jgi:peroxiredoxin-like protein
MQSYPHHYLVDISAEPEGAVTVASHGLPGLATAPPVQYDGPGDQWSPETLMVAAAADCFALTFRAVASVSKLTWTALQCDADGLVDRAEGMIRFTQMTLRARLIVPAGTDVGRARRLLEKAEKACLVTNSLALSPVLVCEVEVS